MRLRSVVVASLSACVLVGATGSRVDAANGVTYTIDPNHSSIEFKVRHLGISTVTGRFEAFAGSVTFDPENPTATRVEVSIQAASIDTRVERRDDHLRSDDFFAAETHPELTFRSTAVRAGDDGMFEVDGELTIRGSTRPVTLEAEIGGMLDRETRRGRTRTVAFSATGRINRTDFGLNWNRALEAGGWVVGEEIRIFLEVEANHRPESE